MAFVARLRSLRRDLAAVAATFSARPPAPAVKTAAPVSSLTPRRLRIARIVRETADAVSLVLEDPTGAPIPFAPGQFFTLHVPVGGEVHKRAYSASSSALDGGRVAVTVKRVADGRVSRHLVGHAHEGDAIDVLGPSGSFTPAPREGPRSLVLVGGGSGITPLSSIARTLLASEPATRVVLVYGNARARGRHLQGRARCARRRSTPEAPAASASATCCRSPPAGWTGGTGLLDGAALARELDALGDPDAPAAEYFLCGPAPMMAAARACLERRGVAPSQHSRGALRLRTRAARRARVGGSARGDAADARGRARLVVAAGRTVLETALDAGVDMPFSCAVGGCGDVPRPPRARVGRHGRAELPLGRRARRRVRPRVRVASDRTLHARSPMNRATAGARWRDRRSRGAPEGVASRSGLALQDGRPLPADRHAAAGRFTSTSTRGSSRPGRKTGRNSARYGEVHVERIRIVRQLQNERFMPLKAIRAVLDGRDDAFTPEQRGFIVDVKRRLSSTPREAARCPPAGRRARAPGSPRARVAVISTTSRAPAWSRSRAGPAASSASLRRTRGPSRCSARCVGPASRATSASTTSSLASTSAPSSALVERERRALDGATRRASRRSASRPCSSRPCRSCTSSSPDTTPRRSATSSPPMTG